MTEFGTAQLVIGALVVFNFGFILGLHFGFEFRSLIERLLGAAPWKGY